MNSRVPKPKWRIPSKVLASIIVLSLILLISPGHIDTANPEEGIIGATKATPISPERILIGVVEWTGWAPLVVAEEKGFFNDEGLNVKVVVFPGPSSRYNAFMAGNIQFSVGFTGDYALQAAKGYPVTIIMEVDFSNTWIIIIKDEFKDLSELEGRIVACDMGSVGYVFLEKALERYGLTTNDIIVIDALPDEALVAFIRGTVDAAVSWEQSLAREAVNKGKGKVVTTSADIPGMFTDVICVQNKFLEENPEAVIKVLRCWFRALKWGEEHPDEYYEIANKKLFYRNPQTKEDLIYSQSLIKMLKPEEIKQRMKEGGPLYQYCQEILDFYYDQGIIDSKTDPANFINNELYLEALDAYCE